MYYQVISEDDGKGDAMMLTQLRDLHTRLTSPPWGWQLGFNRRIDFGV